MINFLFIVSSLIIYLLILKINNQNMKIILLILNTILLIFFIYKLRVVSLDYNSYKIYYFDSIALNYRFNYEYGFRLLNKILYSIFGNQYEFAYLSYCVIISMLFYKSIKLYCKSLTEIEIYFIILFIFEATMMSNLIRQYIAIGIIFYGYRYVVENKFLKFLICCIIAMQFHMTAILGIIIYLIPKGFTDIKKRFKYISIISFIFFIIFYIFNDRFMYKISKYIINGSEKKIDFGIISIAIFILYLFGSYFIIKNKIEDKYRIIILGAVYYLLFLGFINYGFVNRISIYFKPFVYLIISYIPNIIKNDYLNSIYIISFSILGLLINI